jgi:hypothetical protein
MHAHTYSHAGLPFYPTAEKLLGFMDNDTREWFDGVLTAAARQVRLNQSRSSSRVFAFTATKHSLTLYFLLRHDFFR